MFISVNELISFKDKEGIERIERILWIDENSILLFTIDIFSEAALPIIRRGKEIMEGLETGEIIKVKDDPYLKVVIEDILSLKDKGIRDKAWDIINEIATSEHEPDIFYKNKRGVLIKQAMEVHKTSKGMIYKYLKRYWQRGKTKNTLLPDYENSGGIGKEKSVSDKKRGRPRKNPNVNGIGINIDEATMKIFRIAINRYYLTERENTLTVAYTLMLKDFFTEEYTYQKGVKTPILIPEEQRPTFEQFKYWYGKEMNIKNSIVKRKGSKKYELLHRAVLGRSDTDVFGPGSRYQIDATVGNFYLVSRYNRDWIIGKPVIYAVIDVFSRMVTGIYVGLEGPSWLGAMMALVNTATDKVKYCKEYDIDILEEEWPCYHMPEAILGDRGEMESRMVEGLINSLQVKIENTPPFRADWKGIIEQHFDTIDENVKPFVPGHVDTSFRERGTRDYRLDAKLDIFQFTQLMIRCALYYNNSHNMSYFVRNEDMIADDVKPVSIDLWNWGIKNRSGRLRTFSEDIVKLNLMPREIVTITEKGIKLKQFYYSCEKAIKEMWFEKARNRGSWKLQISYDPRNMNYIYIRSIDGRSYEKCFLLESQQRYFNKTMDEIIYLLESEKLNKKVNANIVMQSKTNLINEIQDIVKKAEKMTDDVKNPFESKAGRLGKIKENRKEEKMKNREKEAFILGEEKQELESKVIEIDDSTDISESLEFPDDFELLRRKQKERLNGR